MRIKSLLLSGAAALAVAGSTLGAGPAFADPAPTPPLSPTPSPSRAAAPGPAAALLGRCMALKDGKTRLDCLTAAVTRLSEPRAARCKDLASDVKAQCLARQLRELSMSDRPTPPPVARPGTPTYTG